MSRNPDIDGIKAAAAASIVMIHVSGLVAVRGANWAQALCAALYTGLFAFFCIAGYLHGSLGTRGGLWLRKRFLRLAIPYATWSAIYLFWDGIRGAQAPPLWRVLFFAGAQEVLWSLPVILVCAVAAELLIKTVDRRRLFIATFGLIAVAVALFAPESWRVGPMHYFKLMSIWLAVYAIGMEIKDLEVSIPVTYLLPIAVVVSELLIGLLALPNGVVVPGVARTLTMLLQAGAAGLLVMSAHLRKDWFGFRSIAWGGQLLLGVYVSHVMWQGVVAYFIPVDQFPAFVYVAVAWPVVLGCAVTMTWLLSRNTATRWMVQ